MAIWGVGTDIAEISRFENAQRDRLAKRVLTQNEFAVFTTHTAPHRYLAKRFAVKEATSKALGTGIAKGVTFQDFEVANKESGQPYLIVSGHAAALSLTHKISAWHVSISDEKHYTVATVIAET